MVRLGLGARGIQSKRHRKWKGPKRGQKVSQDSYSAVNKERVGDEVQKEAEADALDLSKEPELYSGGCSKS